MKDYFLSTKLSEKSTPLERHTCIMYSFLFHHHHKCLKLNLKFDVNSTDGQLQCYETDDSIIVTINILNWIFKAQLIVIYPHV